MRKFLMALMIASLFGCIHFPIADAKCNLICYGYEAVHNRLCLGMFNYNKCADTSKGYSGKPRQSPYAEASTPSKAKATFPRVDSDIKEYDDHVTTLKAEFSRIPANPRDKEWVKKKLSHMFDVDQYMRKFSDVMFAHSYSKEEQHYFWKIYVGRSEGVDADDRAELKKLLEIYPWFTVSNFGGEADRNAWIIVQHADNDVPFQKHILGILTVLYPKGETNRPNYAYLFDRVAINEKRSQLYGSQGHCIGPGVWEPWSIEDPTNVDKRRAEMELDPLAKYIGVFKEICKQSDER